MASPTNEPGIILPPTGEPFEIVGTEEAREAIKELLSDAGELARIHYAELDASNGVLLLDVLAHRDYFAGQVSELQASNTALVERARRAEADRDAFSEALDGAIKRIADVQADALNRAAKRATITITVFDTLTGARAMFADGRHETGERVWDAIGRLVSMYQDSVGIEILWPSREELETRALTGEVKAVASPLRHAFTTYQGITQLPIEKLWAYVVADDTGVMLLEHDHALIGHLDGENIGSPIGDHLVPPSDGIWYWEGTARWSGGFDCEGNTDAAELTLEGTWTPSTVREALTTEAPEPSPVGALPPAPPAMVECQACKTVGGGWRPCPDCNGTRKVKSTPTGSTS
jgi:hypothetical protein